MVVLLKDIEKELTTFAEKESELPLPLISEIHLDLKDVHFAFSVYHRNTKSPHLCISPSSNPILPINNSRQCSFFFCLII